ncbi:integrase core domain-containing protein [Jeongeupia sp. USM3]|uniref:integrase core domain-containing protein n=1 Tax=Jeongeupia sp. USM3 TaxID=1906741 RepID=UPI0009F23BB6|nr:integrase core domain-containing protein [Jeongeupia sp. USM3]
MWQESRKRPTSSRSDGRLRDECRKEHCFTNPAHARVLIEVWRQKCNEKRPEKA